MIDSSNSNMSLEVAITLRNKEGKTVSWPTGTNISINGGPMKTLDNNLVIYEYKEHQTPFMMDNIKKDILGECYFYNVLENDTDEDFAWVYYNEETGKYFYYTGYVNNVWQYNELPGELSDKYIKYSNHMNIALDFASADIEDYIGNTDGDNSYSVMLELYRTDDPKFPNETTSRMQEGEIRKYSSSVFCESNRDLAVVLEVKDTLDLGINLYGSNATEYDIPFANRFDFSGLIYEKRKDADIATCAGKKYKATYRLYKKVKNTQGHIIKEEIGYNNNIASLLKSSDGNIYELVDWMDSPFELYDENGTKMQPVTTTVNGDENQSVIVTTRQFTDEQIKTGIDNVEYVVEWDMKLRAKANMLNNNDLTNYKLTATYVSYSEDSEEPETDQEQTWIDYFVFTVAKIRTQNQ